MDIRVMKYQQIGKMHNKNLHDWKPSPNFIRCVKPRIMVFAEHVAHIPENERLTNFWKEDNKKRDYLEDLEVYGKILI